MGSPKVIILTGASRGIGLAAAHFLLKQKHNLVVVARSKGPLDELKQQYGDQVQILTGDLSDLSMGQKALDLATSTWNRLDGLILNHGVLDPVKRVAQADPKEWRKAFDINFFSCVAAVKACLPILRENKGRIVMCSSGAATSAYSGWGAYGATKAAMNHLVATVAYEEPDVIAVSMRPGVVDTAMQQAIREDHGTVMDKDATARFKDLHSKGELLKPEQPGHVMAQLATDAPKDISGVFLPWNDERLAAFQNK
ncbi:oxidoreductase-like protein 14 [Elsinoe australis]|uniref:Oxidoreductase-like protein 14 n=1 Tax=Elsinoe australis TaxID=40998 RepID=A0A4V6DUZ8_9PEZI|nr:oxidoreductase-like protein 14 [Elsinoe australis]